MNKLLVICGPTATGKTNVALHLAKVFDGELVSADSRQVYKYMDIGTGKDLPKNSQFTIRNSQLGGYYTVGGINIWGYDLVEPTKEFSVGQYMKIATQIIKDIRKRGKLPILVGGTGFYIKGVVDGIPTAFIPKNTKLRKSFEDKGASELFEILTKLDPIKAASMNTSDRKNPRRLIRALEVAENVKVKDNKKPELIGGDVLLVGLKAPTKYLCTKIKTRVQERIDRGLLGEIESLFSKGVTWKHQSMNCLGYKQWEKYLFGRRSQKIVIEKWIKDECHYVKRQLTWFKREKRIYWFDVSKDDWQKNIEKLVSSWYSEK